MKFTLIPVFSLTLLLAGCAESDSTATQPAPAGDTAPSSTDLGEASSEPPEIEPGETNDSAGSAPQLSDEAVVTLTPENTKIQFVGTHSPPKEPEPRTGHFEKFSAWAAMDGGGVLKSVHVEIETASLTTQNEKLKNHLKSADFFDVNQHPKATFVSTAIEDSGDGTVKITGDLTLLGTTKSISFPATVSTEGGLKIDAKFEFDRTEFGMDYGQGQVENMVEMTVSVDA